jgi:hypothetical protein
MSAFPPLPPPPPGAAPEVEEAAPSPPSRSAARAIAVVAATLVVIAGVVGFGMWWLGGPGICDESTVESSRFGYCVAAPGWRFTNENTGTELPYDELIKPADASTVRIVAVQLQSGQGLDDVVSTVRDIETGDGAELSEVVDRRVAGVPAAQWDIALGQGQVAQQVREVIFVRGDAAWRVQLQADLEGFDVRAEEFEDILRSWTFR